MNHSFDIEHAGKFGMVEAVLISNFEHWITKNVANRRHLHDGKTWTYNSVKAFEELFPYLTGNQIRRGIESLVTHGVLVRGNYNPSTYDRTSWFTFSDAFAAQIHLAKITNGSGKKGNSLIRTNINTDAEEIGFASFWSAYPKKTAKPAALKAFKSAKLKPEELARILADIAARSTSDDWTKEGGKYVPNPATYLNQRRWEDGQAAAAEMVRFV